MKRIYCMKNRVIRQIAIAIALTSSIFIGCKKDIREPSEIYKAPVYPANYTTPPCENSFYQAGNNLSFKRSVIEIISGSLAFYPFFSKMDSTATTYYKSSRNYFVYSFQDAVFSSNNIEIYFKYFNPSNTGVYNIVSEDKLIAETLENNECVIRGNAAFQTFGSSGYYNFSIYPKSSGKLYLGKDRYTNKKNFFVCDADCSIFYNGYERNALLTFNLTL